MVKTASFILLVFFAVAIAPMCVAASPSVVIKDSSATGQNKSWLPGGGESSGNYSPTQDSLYFRAMRMKIPYATRFAIEMQELAGETPFVEPQENTLHNAAMRNLSMIPASQYAPDPREVVNFQQNIQNAFYVPFTPPLMTNGLKVSLQTIGRIFGIVEDVSPKISYTLDVKTDVEVVVYSIQASVIQTIFKGTQKPGSYSFTWNLRNDEGRLMPRGDYIIEVRIGDYRYQRKRTLIK